MNNDPLIALEDDQWLPVSDLMAGLMMVFLFISIAMMSSAYKQRDKAKQQSAKMEAIANEYVGKHKAIFESLNDEFKQDFENWNVEHDEDTLTVTFNAPSVQFAENSYVIPTKFKETLENFFPRYVKILEPYRNDIQEVRIEGHTNSLWRTPGATAGGYFRNMELSQRRTLSVLEFVYGIDLVDLEDREWIKSNVAAVGHSFSQLVFDDSGNEDMRKSRRVTFRVLTNADREIRKILEGIE